MVTALAAAGLAALLWPGGGADRRMRLRSLAVARRCEPRQGPPWSRGSLPAAAGAGAVVLVSTVSTPLVAVLAGVLTALAGRAWNRHRDGESDEQRLVGLVAGLTALAADLRSGRSLAEATDAAAAACGDQRTGRDLVRAVRVPDQAAVAAADALRGPLARLSGAVLLSGRTGCSLAEVVSSVEDDLRARHRAELELRSATAGPRAGALLLAGLPVLGLAMGSGVGADPWGVLTTTGTGQVLLVAGVALELAGVAWSSRLVRRAVR
jgi:tight adherence protein B